MSYDCDVLIVGAGPAGCAVAARLSQYERPASAILLDRYRFPRDKPCGGALTGHADPIMSELELSLSVPHQPCTEAAVRFGAFERVVTMGESVDVVRREDFDASLVAQVRARGAELREGVAVRGYVVDQGGVTVTTTAGELRCRVLVGADGAASVVRKQILERAGATPHRLFMAELTCAGPSWPVDRMLYDFSLMSRGLRGYLWVFPVPGGRVNVGLMHYPSATSPRSGRELTELLRAGLTDHGIELPERACRGWPVWGYDPSAPISSPRVLTVGDAAGIDGLTGEGIAIAMEQALICGDEIAMALRSGDVGFARYGRAIRRATVGRELGLDRWLARLLYGGTSWEDWLSLVLFDRDVIEMYARRVDGTEVLADQKLRLYRALLRHAVLRRRRRRKLASVSGSLAAPRQLKG